MFSVSADDYLKRLPAQDDAPAYLDMARIWKGEATYQELNRSPFVRVPGYAWFIVGIQKLTGPNIGGVLIFQQAIELGIIILLYWWLNKQYGRQWSLGIAIGLTLFFDFTMYGFLIRSEVLFTCLILITVLLFLRLLDTYNWTTAIAVGGILGGATLTRPISALLIFPLIFMLATKWFSNKHVDGKKCLITILMITLVFAAVLSPWIYRNWHLSGHLLLQQDTGNIIYMTFPGGHWQSRKAQTLVDTKDKSELDIDRELTKIALIRIAKRPDIWLKNVLRNFLFRLWSMGFTDSYLRYFKFINDTGGYHKGGSLINRWEQSINIWRTDTTIPKWLHVYWILNNGLGFSMIGWSLLALIRWRELSLKNQTIFGILLYFWAMTSIFSFSGSRYMIPMVPLLFMLIPNLIILWLPKKRAQAN